MILIVRNWASTSQLFPMKLILGEKNMVGSFLVLMTNEEETPY